MQYQVPQFVEIEDKIFGPLTFKQFAYLAGAGGICLVFLTLLPLWLALILALPFVGLGLALAFYTINGRPFINAMEYAVRFYIGEKLYLWKQREKHAPAPGGSPLEAAASQPPLVPKISESKLKDLAWSLNIKDRRTYNSL